MSLPTARTLATLAGFTILSWLGSAAAAPCGRPDIDAMFPSKQAMTVPPNATLAAHYGSPAVYDGEPVSLTDSAGAPVSITVTYDEADSMLRATPDEQLGVGSYRLDWPGLRGVGNSGVGRGDTALFGVTSRNADSSPPVFAGLTDVSWDLSRDRDPCLDRLDDRFVFKLRVGQASDDSGTELLALLAFQTLDPISPEQTEPSSLGVYPWPADGVLEVRRPATAAGQTCFAAVAQDMAGAVSGGGEHEVCVKTKKPPFFEGCTVAAPGRAPARPTALSAGLLLAGLALLGRGRAARARAPRVA